MVDLLVDEVRGAHLDDERLYERLVRIRFAFATRHHPPIAAFRPQRSPLTPLRVGFSSP